MGYKILFPEVNEILNSKSYAIANKNPDKNE